MATCSSRLSLLLTTVVVLMVIWYVLGQNDENQRLSRSDYYAGRQFLNAEPSRVRRTDRTRTSEGEKNKTSAVADSGILGKSNKKFILGMSNETLCTGRSRRGANPLCTNHSSLIVFSRMSPTVVWQLYLHKEEAEKCVLPNNVICFLTDDYLYYQTADVLLARDCSDLCNQPAYPNQLIVRYNRGPPRMHGKQCRLPSPDFMRVSYTLSSTIPYPYMCYPETRQPLIDALKLGPPSGRHGIAVFVSDPTRWRKKYLKELMKYIHIDSYGDVLHNTDMPSSRGKGSDDFISVKLNMIKEKGYKYLIAFENSIFLSMLLRKSGMLTCHKLFLFIMALQMCMIRYLELIPLSMLQSLMDPGS